MIEQLRFLLVNKVKALFFVQYWRLIILRFLSYIIFNITLRVFIFVFVRLERYILTGVELLLMQGLVVFVVDDLLLWKLVVVSDQGNVLCCLIEDIAVGNIISCNKLSNRLGIAILSTISYCHHITLISLILLNISTIINLILLSQLFLLPITM